MVRIADLVPRDKRDAGMDEMGVYSAPLTWKALAH